MKFRHFSPLSICSFVGFRLGLPLGCTPTLEAMGVNGQCAMMGNEDRQQLTLLKHKKASSFLNSASACHIYIHKLEKFVKYFDRHLLTDVNILQFSCICRIKRSVKAFSNLNYSDPNECRFKSVWRWCYLI